MTHIVAGYPSLERSEALALMMADAGASYLEIQIPFSDPIADGPTILRANQRALESDTKVEDCFELMDRLQQQVDIPLLFMSYFNIPFHYGLEAFCQRAKQVGCYGLIIPDMPIDEEEQEHYLSICSEVGLHPIQVISPITPEERLRKIGEVASGFVYCVSRTGTTGARNELSTNVPTYLERVRRFVSTPLSLGFGISTPEQVCQALQSADIAVIGSAVLKKIEAGASDEELRSFLTALVTS